MLVAARTSRHWSPSMAQGAEQAAAGDLQAGWVLLEAVAAAYRREGWRQLLGQALLQQLDIARRSGWKQVCRLFTCVWHARQQKTGVISSPLTYSRSKSTVKERLPQSEAVLSLELAALQVMPQDQATTLMHSALEWLANPQDLSPTAAVRVV